MEGVKLRAVNDGRLVLYENISTVFKRVEDNGTSVAKTNLENGPAVLPPPLFACRRMVFAKLEKVAGNRNRTGNLGNALNVRDIGVGRKLVQSVGGDEDGNEIEIMVGQHGPSSADVKSR